MKCFVVVAFLAASAAAVFLQDTPDVAAAKQQFYSAYNQAARAAQAASPYREAHSAVAVDANADPGQVYPTAVPYVHVDVPAEPYVHQEPPRRRNGGGAAPARPVQQTYAQPAQPAQPAYNYQALPQAPTASYQQNYNYQQPQPQYNNYINNPQYNSGYQSGPWKGGCYNNKGEGVDCRTDFSENLPGYY